MQQRTGEGFGVMLKTVGGGSNMEFELGTGFLTMTDIDTGEQFDLGEVTSMSLEQEIWSSSAVPSKILNGFTNSATFSCEITTINQDLCKLSPCLEFTTEGETPTLIQTRWHKKARIRKKWLKRYGYKEDKVKTIMKAKHGEFNKETGEFNIEIESIEYIFKPYQLQRKVRR